MLHLKTAIALAVMSLLLVAAGPAFPQMLSDAYALAETRADIPANWEPWPQTRNNQRGESARQSDHNWMGRREKATEPVSPQNHILVSARVAVTVCNSPTDARTGVENLLRMVAVPPVRGAYTRAPLGDYCLRGPLDPNGAYLYFCRSNAFFMVDMGGPAGDLNYPVVAEKIARAMLARADAALALAAAGGGPAGGGPSALTARSVGPRQPRGVPVVLVDEWAPGAAATWKADWQAGVATVSRATHTLRLMVGRRDAMLDGKQITLPFPALRQGKDRLWCPTATLSKLTG